MTNIDQYIYTPASVREMDRIAIEQVGIEGYELMSRAGAGAFTDIRSCFPDCRHWLVLCGAGNNAGDGYVIARLARAAGLDVTTMALTDPDSLNGDAHKAWQDYQNAGGAVAAFDERIADKSDLIIDACLGTGIDRPVSGHYAQVINWVNNSEAPCVAVDVPSGLNSASGAVMGAAIKADLTVTFVGLKQGFYLADGPDHCGDILFHDLEIPATAVTGVEPSLLRFNQDHLAALLPPRQRSDHKGRFGHVLVIGGNHGMAGAVRLCGEAALRSGAGLVSVATRDASVAPVVAGRPELMVRGFESGDDIDDLLERATVIALGPGLGQDDWSQHLFSRVMECPQPKVLDADALNLLAAEPARQDQWVLTPHPGEAARLLGCSAAEVQSDRPAALAELTERYGGTVILKGNNTLIGDAGHKPYLVDRGNPGMATAGMGDVLTGLVAGLLAQQPDHLFEVAAAAVYVHAMAGDIAAEQGLRSLIAGDLFAPLRIILE